MLRDVLDVEGIGSRGRPAEGEFLATLQLPFDIFAQEIVPHMCPVPAEVMNEPSALQAGTGNFKFYLLSQVRNHTE